jgi:hypothetical protein
MEKIYIKIKIEWNKSMGKPFAAKGLQGSRAG